MEDVYSKGVVCNAGNSDKKYGSKHKDVSVTVQGNKSEFNHSSSQQRPWDFPLQVGTKHSTRLNKNYISLSFRSVVGCDWSKPVQTSRVCMI